MSSIDYDNSSSRRVRATRFEQVILYSVTQTVKTFQLQIGLYEISAEGSEVYVLDGEQSSFVNAAWGRIEAGDFKVWESRKTGDSLSVYLSVGASVRITRRANG